MVEKQTKLENLENKDVVLSDGEARNVWFPTVSEMWEKPEIPPEGDELEQQLILQPAPMQSSDTIANVNNVSIETPTAWWEQEEQKNTPSDEEWKFALNWTAIVWTGVAWDSDEILSERLTTVTVVVDVSHIPTWAWISVARVDDFHNDPEQPLSRVTVLNPHINKNFWEKWEFWVAVEWKYTFIDNLPEANWFSPDVVLSYKANWWRSFEWVYAHKFLSWPDSDSFRLSVAKQINEAVRLTWQWWYETWYDKHFYWRVIVDVNLWNWFWAQVSCMAKHWELTPTAWIVFHTWTTFWKKRKHQTH